MFCQSMCSIPDGNAAQAPCSATPAKLTANRSRNSNAVAHRGSPRACVGHRRGSAPKRPGAPAPSPERAACTCRPWRRARKAAAARARHRRRHAVSSPRTPLHGLHTSTRARPHLALVHVARGQQALARLAQEHHELEPGHPAAEGAQDQCESRRRLPKHRRLLATLQRRWRRGVAVAVAIAGGEHGGELRQRPALRRGAGREVARLVVRLALGPPGSVRSERQARQSCALSRTAVAATHERRGRSARAGTATKPAANQTRKAARLGVAARALDVEGNLGMPPQPAAERVGARVAKADVHEARKAQPRGVAFHAVAARLRLRRGALYSSRAATAPASRHLGDRTCSAGW
eukprot:scaffold1423_cov314-Prasinococcus_capsulatus_cf.AAC.6